MSDDKRLIQLGAPESLPEQLRRMDGHQLQIGPGVVRVCGPGWCADPTDRYEDGRQVWEIAEDDE